MGCNQSKNADIQKSQEPRARQASTPAAPSQSQSTPIGTGVIEKRMSVHETLPKLGTSLHDQREGEMRFYKQLTAATAANFIDIMLSVSPYDPAEFASRAKEYSSSRQIRAIRVDSSFLRAPPKSHLQSPKSAPFVPRDDSGSERNCLEQGTQYAEAVHEAAKFQIRDCGALVVPLKI
eukprot:TRINITY_DN29256_c0_g1_i1.p1 TRINITY_DN29256_c0_g1~~TRINITY_DN29256_c0_g1_i1.p1  ORF type:complete len:178 (+),score=43.45 TRINITY_DN29256_c0_g1_i1:74-607(+)